MLQIKSGFFITIFICATNLLLGCQSHHSNQSDMQTLLYDQGFETFKSKSIESEADIFFLDSEAKQFVHQNIDKVDQQAEQIKALIHALFAGAEFNILYEGNANTTANETFKNKAANCLSLSIMTFSLAQEAGIDAQFQDIEIPEYWTRNKGYSMLNKHINLRLVTSSSDNDHAYTPRYFYIDFDPLSARNRFEKHHVDKATVVAMFYNNKGAEALVDSRFDDAYAYLRQALIVDPLFAPTAINLGILYRMKGFVDQAEVSYQHALQLDPNNLTAMENLAYLYQTTDRETHASLLLERVAKKRADNPYFHMNLGEEALDAGHYLIALDHFRTAMDLDRRIHEVYFKLARVYLALGDIALTEHYLELAKELSDSDEAKKRYQDKLDLLTRL